MTWFLHAWPQVLDLVRVHLLLAVPALLASIVVAVPIGRLAHARPRIGGPMLGFATLLYAIPALPLLIIIPVLLGIPLRSAVTMIIALTVYGVALLARTAADAFGAVDAGLRQAAVAMGFSRTAVFWRVDLPLATPVLVSGARVAAVSTVGLVTVGALIGIPGLGVLFTDGFQRGITAEVITGIIATTLIALALDGLCMMLGRTITPWTRAATGAHSPESAAGACP
jgi:osmoprotectant transport system permease protein